MDDKDAGKIIGKGILIVPSNVGLGIIKDSYVTFTATIDVKDNKFRCILSDFYHDGFVDNPEPGKGGYLYQEKPDGGLSKKWWQRLKDNTKVSAEEFLSSFDIAMKKTNSGDNF